MENEIIRSEESLTVREPSELTVTEIVAKVAKVKEVAEKVMKKDVHYGIIPGTPKPTLYKPGGEILGLTFRLSPKYEGEREPIDLGKGHREYVIRCDLFHIHSGLFYGSGIGSCSTMEGKFRYRTGPKEFTGQPVPKDYWDLRNSDPGKAKELLGGAGFAVGKNEAGGWEICIQGERIEHDNPADYYNTVLKMAGKRAYIDAILKATAASEVYTQDLEDMQENGIIGQTEGKPPAKPPIQQPQRKSEQAAPANGQPAAGPATDNFISKGKVSRLWAKAYELNLKTHDEERKLVADILVTFGYDHVDKIRRVDYEKIITAIQSGKVPEVHADPDPMMERQPGAEG